ncbi:MAG: sigma-70 family RNA polymerase sigma factor [Bacteroidetes bacterium]|jgi:RNA polymerase sigma-70 factor (ECF subfamily)|nr:sigma-70 family RNA polymerase sigma factor [Bacteroidota bacterium]
MSEPVTERDLGAAADDVLVSLVQRGDQRAFRHLVQRHHERVRRLLFAIFRDEHLVEDLAQEVFIKAYEALSSFRFESSFYTWLYRIAVNKGRDEMRRRKLRRFFSLQQLDDGARAELEARMAEKPADIDANDLVSLGLRMLPDHHREVVIMKDLQGFSYEEIAEILHIEVGTVKSRLSRARTALKQILGPMLDKDTA